MLGRLEQWVVLALCPILNVGVFFGPPRKPTTTLHSLLLICTKILHIYFSFKNIVCIKVQQNYKQSSFFTICCTISSTSVNAWLCFIVVFTQMSMSVQFKTILNFWKTSDNLGIFPFYSMLLSRFFAIVCIGNIFSF